MDQMVIQGYVEKFGKLVECCLYAHQTFEEKIIPKSKKNPALGAYWEKGASAGLMIYFLRTLSEDEKVISDMVLDRVAEKLGGKDRPVDVNDYIETAIIVLEDLGCHIPIPDEG